MTQFHEATHISCALGNLDFYPVEIVEPGVPTNALPGSREKIKVMRRRAKKELSLFHGGDLAAEVPRTDMVASISKFDRIVGGRGERIRHSAFARRE